MDRVTYTERDVVNRAIDDVVPTVVGGVPIRPNLYGDDVHYLGFWPDNTMGTDFYRTLERKYHALYNGDRFGTSNRWEATDGNYDDWSHDPVLLGNPKWNGSPAEPNAAYVVLDDTYYGSAAQNKKVSDMTREIAVASSLVDNATGYLTGTTIIRCDGFAPVPILNDYCQFAGDPTRYRVIGYDRTNRLLEIDASGLLNPVSNNTAVTIYRKVVALQNNPLVSVGDLMRLPYLSIRKDCWAFGSAVYGGALDDLRLAELQGLLAGHRPYDNDMPMDRDPVWGVNYRAESRYLDALMAVGTVGAKTLTAGQARYYQLNPIEGGVEDEWGAAGVPPQSWRPVHLYPLPAAVAETDDFLFQMPALPDWMVPPTWLEVDGLVDRWALEWPPAATPPLKYPRAAMYVSSNTDAMDIASIMSPHGPGVAAESLFVWTADEGVVNGEYDLYIDVGANLDKIRSGPATSLGQEVATWAGLGGTTLPTELAMDVVALTDRDNNGTCWTEPGPSFATLNMVSESFGMREGLRPDTNGYIHYGMVRVENRYLAVFLRNWTVAGKPNRFLGVILAPRAQTPGRVNVNTVQSLVCDNQARALNPLMGVPGVLLDLYQPTLPPSANPVPPGLPLPALSAAGAATLADDRARIIERDRPEHWDGRYYRFMADVAGYQYPNGGATLTRYPLSNPNYSVTDPAVAQFVFDESAWRMSRMANLITTRSDVFEIVVTAQAGYLANDSFYDDDGNPITPNWRDDENFVVQAETKTRTVYER